MSSIVLKSIVAPQPSTERNFTTHLSYDETTDSIAYASGKSAFIRPLDDDSSDSVVQFTGHGSANVTVVKFSPIKGSQFLCSGDESGKVIVWGWSKDDKTGIVETNIKSEFQVLAGRITDISWDFEGRRLCVVGEGRDRFGAFISWDSGNSLGEVSGHSQRINACHIKQSRPMRAVTVSDDASVIFYQGPPFKFTSSDRTHHVTGKFIRDVKFSPGEGEFVVSVGSDRKINCFDGKTGEFIKNIEDSNETIEGGIFAISWVDETKFVTASADATIRLWDVKESKCLQKWIHPEVNLSNQQIGIVVATKNNTIISLSLDGTLNFFKIGENSLQKKIKGHNKAITALRVNPLVTGSYDGKVMDWSKTPAESLDNHNNMIIEIDNSNKNGIATISWDDTLKIGNKLIYKFEKQPKVASSNKDGIIGVITSDDELIVMQSENGKIISQLKLKESATCIGISKQFITIGYERSKKIEIFNSSDLTVSHELKNPPHNTPSSVSISPSEKFIAVGDVMGKIILYDMETREVKTSRWSFHTGRINSIEWQDVEEEDGEEEYVVSSSLDTNIIIYSVKRPMRNIKYLNAHKEGVNSVQWIDKNTLVSVGVDACIKKWDVIFE